MKNHWLDKDSDVVCFTSNSEKVEVEFSNGHIYQSRRDKRTLSTDLIFPEHLSYDEFLRKSLREMRESGKASKSNEIQEKEYRTAETYAEVVFFNVCTGFDL